MSLTGATVRNSVRQIAFTGGAAKHGLNERTVAVDIRHHDDNVARRQRRVGLQHRQQAVVQHFNFALRTMANVDGEAAVISRQQALVAAVGKLFGSAPGNGGVFQLQYVVLKVV